MGDLGPAEIRLMQGLAQQVMAARLDLVNGDATVGELAWVWAKDVDALGPFWRHRIWFADGQLAGWAWAHLPRGETTEANLLWQVHPDRPDLLPELLDWYDEVAGDADRLLTFQIADVQARAAVAAHGYEFDAETGSDTGSWHQFNQRELTELPDPVLPPGFRFRTAEDVSVADAVTAHRAAWNSTRLTEPAFERVQRTWPYRPDLHLLIQAPDGTLAATAIIWLDEMTRTAEFEPVGTHPDFRRRGLGTALQLYGMHRAKAAGATRMLVACLGSPARPAARNLYYGVGFREFTRDVPQIKRR